MVLSKIPASRGNAKKTYSCLGIFAEAYDNPNDLMNALASYATKNPEIELGFVKKGLKIFAHNCDERLEDLRLHAGKYRKIDLPFIEGGDTKRYTKAQMIRMKRKAVKSSIGKIREGFRNLNKYKWAPAYSKRKFKESIKRHLKLIQDKFIPDAEDYVYC